MIRNYSSEPVDSAALERLLANAVRAPSAGFTQGWAFLVLDSPDDVDRFWEAATPPRHAAEPDSWLRGLRTAPVVVVPMSHEAAYRARYAEADKRRPGAPEQGWPVPYWHLDAAMASLLFLLTAVDEGLGACFFGLPATRTQVFREAFGVPETFMPVGVLTVGHRTEDPGPAGSAHRGRRPLEEVVHRGRW